MRIRLVSAIAVSGLALAGVLVSFCRVPAGEIVVPTAPVVPVKSDIQVLPEISTPTAKPASPCEVKACGGLVGSGLGADAVRVEAPAVPTTLVNTRRVHLNFEISDVGPSGSEAIRTVQEVLLVDRFQNHDDRPLKHLVFERRYPDRTGFCPRSFRNMHPAHGRCPVSAGLGPV